MYIYICIYMLVECDQTAGVYVHICMYIYFIYMCTYICTCTYVTLQVNVDEYDQTASVCVLIYTFIHIYVCIHIYT